MKQEHHNIWHIRPFARDKQHSNAWTKRIATSLHKWISFTETVYQEWPERPQCGYFFGGAYWYGFETAHTVAVYAVLATITEPGVSGSYDKAHLTDRAISAIRYLVYTHDTGPEQYVRVASRNRVCSETKWGGRDDRYFMATQVGGAISYLGLAAWLLWDQLDDETRIMVQNTVSSYADRWAEFDPLNGTYFDTQLEENAWTAVGIFTAALLFPDHPHQDKWWSAYHKWNINTTTTYRDRLSDVISQGVPLKQRVKAITLHPDYTTENHAFVHPTYMAASLHFRGREIADLLLAGLPLDTMDVLNDREMYERTLKPWAEADGIPTSVQGQDWWYNQQHGFLHAHALMNVLHHDGEAALLEDKALTVIEALQNSNDRGCYMEQNGEHCHIMPKDDQTAIDMEHMSASHMLNTYLIHKLGGAGAEPVAEEQLVESQSGVRVYPYGGFIIHRTARTSTSFSWRNHVMALSMPHHGAWLQSPLYDSYTGIVRIKQDHNDAVPYQESFVIDVLSHRLDVQADGFSAYAILERGSKHLLQHIGFVSLPDGRSLYWEQFEAKSPVTITTWETGAIGIRNEHYSALTNLAKGYRTVNMAEQSQRFESWRVNSSDTIADYPACGYVNVDDEAGYLLYGSSGIRYFNQHVYGKWKGGEDRLILNHHTAPVTLQTGECSHLFAIVNLPNYTTAQTAQLAGTGRYYAGSAGLRADSATSPSFDATSHAAVWHDGQYLVYFNSGERQESLAFTETHSETAAPLFLGTNRFAGDSYTWSGVLPAGHSGYYKRSGTVALIDGSNEDELEISVSSVAVIFMNKGAHNVSFLYTPNEDGAHQQIIELPAGAFLHLPVVRDVSKTSSSQ